MRDLRKRRGGKAHADLELKGLRSAVPPFAWQMPAVGARRSTRVFVPKAASKVAAVGVGVGDGDAAAAVVLRSGKRLVVSKPAGKKVEADGCREEWMRLFGWQVGCGGDGWGKGRGVGGGGGGLWREGESPRSVMETDEDRKVVVSSKKFGIVYSRKRRRTSGSDDVKGRRFGLSFTRRKQRNITGGLNSKQEVDIAASKIASLAGNTTWWTASSLGGHEIPDSARIFAVDVGVRHGDLWDGRGHLGVLLVLVDSSDCTSLHHFGCFLLSALSGMRRKRVKLPGFSSFLLSNTFANIFSKHGVHFLPVKWESYIYCRNAIYGAGICGIFGARMSIPLLSVTFSALVFYFRSLHLSMLLDLRPRALAGYSPWEGRLVDLSEVQVTVPECPYANSYTGESMDASIENMMLDEGRCDEGSINPVNHQLSRLEDTHVLEDPKLVVQNDTAHWMKVRRHQKKRTSLRSSRVRSSSMNTRRSGVSSIHKRILKVNSAVKVNPLQLNTVVPTFTDATDSCPSDFSGASEDHALVSPMSPNQDLKKSAQKNSGEMAKLKQNIDSIRAKANILVIKTDRCWREGGAEVMLEASDSNEWCLAVKVNGSIRYLHKAQEMKPCATNRYTHAMIWTSENGWKLEFADRMDWLMFKELHKECSDRNSNEVTAKMIPVPVVRIVPGYEEIHGTFARPNFYINKKYDEVERALMSESAYYDMDSEDEQWLRHLNSNPPGGEGGGPTHISDDNFEKIIFALEKAAYNNPDEVCDQEKAIGYCLDFGSKDMLAAIFDYWSKKKRQKHAALIRVFQEPSRKTPVTQKPFLRKKRSLKRQGSYAGRGKPEFYLQVGAMKEESRRVEEAKSAATAAMEVATKLRSRVQILMANADLATYKAALALRLAEAIRESASPDLASSILD